MRRVDASGRSVTPVYLLIQSPVAEDEWALALREGIDEVFDHFALNPAEGEHLYVAVNQFADTLYMNRPLAPVSELPTLCAPIVPMSGLATDIPLKHVNRLILEDAQRLRSSGLVPGRPLIVYVVTGTLFGHEVIAQELSGTSQSEQGVGRVEDQSPLLVVLQAEVLGYPTAGGLPASEVVTAVHQASDASDLIQVIPAVVIAGTKGRSVPCCGDDVAGISAGS